MLSEFFLFTVLIFSYAMVIGKRIPALLSCFRGQSFFLFLSAFFFALQEMSVELFIVAALLFVMKVILIPYFLQRLIRRIKVQEHAGMFVNPLLSLVAALLLTYAASFFTSHILLIADTSAYMSFMVSQSVVLIGLFIMVFRMKAVTQIIGLLVMENGIFLLAVSVAGGMPFFVEIAVFFDVLVCVVITGIFMFRINKLFTHIEVHKLSNLKG